jgi:hypothetical protein
MKNGKKYQEKKKEKDGTFKLNLFLEYNLDSLYLHSLLILIKKLKIN